MTIRKHYEYIKFYEELLKYVLQKKDVTEDRINSVKEKLIQEKRECRKKVKGSVYDHYLYPGENGEGYGRIVNYGGDYDYFWKKIFFADEQWNEEDKKEFIEENWVRCTPSQYDCTGQVFTWAIDVFNVPSGVVAYIRYAMDV